MAAVAAQEANIDTPIKAPKTLKTTKTRGKSTAIKTAGSKPSEAKTLASPSIPLICVVCPTHPRFSDISHLLTHLNSKGHLQTLNDARIRALADPSAADAISTYDQWYTEHGLEALLAERLKVKDERAKGPATGGKRPGKAFFQLKRKKTLPILAKREPGNDASWTPPPTGRFLEQQAITFYRDQNSPASTPTDNVPEWTQDELELARLKGTIWPGMGIFDAATPDQKKKRNQRKDASVLQQMELSSQAITTTEFVANLDMEIERTRDVYDAPSVEGTPIARSKRRQKRIRVVDEQDGDDTSEVIVKSEPSDHAAPKACHSKAVRHETRPIKQAPAPEINIEYLSEKLDVTSEAASSVAAEAEADLDAAIEFELHGDVDDSPFGPGSSLNNLNPGTFSIRNGHDVFRDAHRDANRGRAALPQFSAEMMDDARFAVRNRMPLRSINVNSNLSLASPTPTAKQLTHRLFRGKENNHGLQTQRMPADGYAVGCGNSRVNGTRMTNSNSQVTQASMADSNITASPFNDFQQQDMFYQQAPWAYPMVAQASNSRFIPINGNQAQPAFYGHQFSFPAGENSQGNGTDIFGNDL
ncbi:hypothetical protein CH63R_00409 [Colletotrichum higginsianum IMI 349063]|uniref:Uncharacterized protein n=3 Tax=Colletotrichum higginsianum TaxID=80884 RepID=A0A1B7YT57_COLHI|nr:hypothetical protein CH63R_00409 [Colletotrichum higginsianum IMI 349063]OBR15229.1 hypothetical protein CH63R_00409 [Colletotrichum higginsianum IMI 349063]TID04740.1 hypothetical protein CH35J_002954 [Colletotrichum higginsianum]